jgi:DNA-binding response OmpR family regulator
MTQRHAPGGYGYAAPSRLARISELGSAAPRHAGAQSAWQPGRLLFVAPPHDAGRATTQQLRAEGHAVVAAESGEQALELFDDNGFELVLLDTALPGLSGFDTCRLLRARSDVAIVFLTTADSLAERLLGFDLGADDYVTTPVEFAELDRRIRAALWRHRGPSFGGESELRGPSAIVMRLRSHEVLIGGESIHVTPKEFDLLRILLEHRGEVLSSDAISSEIWGYETFGSRNFVEAHISRLRRKLAAAGAPDVVETVRGVGYVIRPESEP